MVGRLPNETFLSSPFEDQDVIIREEVVIKKKEERKVFSIQEEEEEAPFDRIGRFSSESPQTGIKEFDDAIIELRTQVMREISKFKTFAEVLES